MALQAKSEEQTAALTKADEDLAAAVLAQETIAGELKAAQDALAAAAEADLEGKVTALTADLEAAQKAAEEAKAQVEKLTTETGVLNQKISDLTGKLATAEDAVAVAQATIDQQAKEIEALNLQITDLSAEADELIYSGTAKGFAGDVTVTFTLDAEGKIATIKIGDSNFNETPGFGAKALEESFAAQFIGKTVPLTVEDIDGISGATITTKAILDAINLAQP